MNGASQFVHLHIHTIFSLLDGACKIERLCSRAVELGFPALAITDHGNMFGAIKFYKAAKRYGIKPILGQEFYISPTSRKDRSLDEKSASNHLILLAKSYEGYLNLAKLSSIGFLEGHYYKPRIDLEVLSQYSKGLIGMSACLKGAIQEALSDGNERRAGEILDTYTQILGKDSFFLEIMDQNLEEQKRINPDIIRLSRKHEVKLVATNDCHYINKEDAPVQDILMCIQTGKTVQEEQRMKFGSDQFYLKSYDEMNDLFGDEIPDALSNTLEVAEMCNIELPFNQRLLPKFITPSGEPPAEYLEKLVYQGLQERVGDPPPQEYLNRLQHELNVIHSVDFDSYFLIVWDFVRFARENSIPVGPGRGSAAGSLVSYSLKITDLDPIVNGLLFERFLNPERISMPDIDIDFCYEKRSHVINYVRNKYGLSRVAQIITFGTMKARNSVRDVGRVLKIPLPFVDRIAKMIPEGQDIQAALSMVGELNQEYHNDTQVKQLIDIARAVEGNVRHPSIHAAGVVIADEELSSIVPLYKPASEDEIATQFDMHEVEEIGLLKMDFLGLKNLTIIERAIDRIRKTKGVDIDWDTIPLNDAKTYILLRETRTTGIFQLESSGMRDLIRRLQPETFDDIVPLLALYRPGPLQSGMVTDFIDRKFGRKPIIYDHELLEPILKETYGIILYQEQVMKIANVMAGFSLAEADVLRRAMGKKKADAMAAQRSKFIERAVDRGIDRFIAEKIFDQMAHFAGYGFNKSHSAAYGLITFRTAYLKAHYPVEFMASLMTSEKGDLEKMAHYFMVCREMGIKIYPPDINESFLNFTVVGNHIRFGLSAVKNVGESAVEAIIQSRKEGGAFRGLQDFCNRATGGALNSRMIEALIKCGAFDSLGANRPQLLAALPRALEISGNRHRDQQMGQASFLDAIPDETAGSDIDILPDVPDWNLKKKLQFEKDLLGFYVTGHPLDKYAPEIHAFSNVTSQTLNEKDVNQEVEFIGVITKIIPKFDKNARPMSFVEMEDYEGKLEVIFFREAHEKYKDYLHIDSVIWVKGRVNTRNDIHKIQALEVAVPEDVRSKRARSLEIHLPLSSIEPQTIGALKNILERHKGKHPVRLYVEKKGVGEVPVQLGKGASVSIDEDLISDLQENLSGEKLLTFADK